MRSPVNIIIRRSGAIGDVLLATSILPSIVDKFGPLVNIIFVTKNPQVLEGNLYVDEILTTMPQLAPNDIFYDLDLTYELGPQKTIFEAYADVIKIDPSKIHLTYTPTDTNSQIAINILQHNNIDPSKAITLHTGSNSWARNLKPAVFESIISLGKKKLDLQFVHLGTKNDPSIKGTLDLRNVGSIGLSAAIINECRAFIGIDSTLIHFAKALNKPITGFFGPTDPTLRIQSSERDLLITPDLQCKFCHHRLQPPAFVTICKNDLFSFSFDSLWQNMITSKSIILNDYGCRIMNKISQYRNKVNWIPKCMKYDPKIVIQKIEPWLERIFQQ